MYQRAVTILMIVAGLLGVLELISASVIWKENYPDSAPLFAVAFAVLFLGGMALVRAGRVVAGSVLVGTLSLFELVTAPSWERRNALDWTVQGIGVALAAVGVAAATSVIAARRSTSARSS